MEQANTPTDAGTVTAIVSHRVKPGAMAEGVARIRTSGDRMAPFEGFIDRVLLTPTDDPAVLVTITRWKTLDAYQAWVTHNKAHNPFAGTESPYVETPVASVLHPYTGA